MAQLSHDTMVSVVQLSALGRLAVSVYGLSFYLWKTVAPVSLSPLYELPPTVNPWAPPFLLSYGLVVAITAIALAFRRRVPGLPAALLAYVVILLPVLGLFQSGPQIAADRYTYLAGLGWALLTGAGLLSCWRTKRFLIPGCAVCVVVGLGVLTWNQVQIWHDSERLWTHVLAIDPQSSIAENNLGIVRADQKKRAEAIEHYQRALQIRPEYAQAHYNLGVALAQQGKPAEAIEHYRQALRIKPDDALAHNNWGVVLAEQGRLAEAIEHFQVALRIKPDDALAHTNWGAALAQQGKLAEASDHYRQALQIEPDAVLAHNNWGLLLDDQGKLAEAIEHYRQGLQVKPAPAEAHTNWGTALAQPGKLAEAIEHFRQAPRVNPDFAQARSKLLNALQGADMGKEEAGPNWEGKKSE